MINIDDKDMHDRELIEEINRKYQQLEDDYEEPVQSKLRSYLKWFAALILVIVFFISATGLYRSSYYRDSYDLLKESWVLTRDPLVKELRSAVVRVNIRSDEGRTQAGGTGFNIAPEGVIVTNRHLVEDAHSIEIIFPLHGTYTVDQWIVSLEVDLAIIQLHSENLPVVEITGNPVSPGEEVIIIGNPLRLFWMAGRGVIRDYGMKNERPTPLLIVEADVHPGSSGSPVFNEDGEVVGIIYAILYSRDGSTKRGVALDAVEVTLFLETVNR